VTQAELISAEVPIEKLDCLSRDELVQFLKLEQGYRIRLEREVKRLRALNEELEQRSMFLEDQHVVIKNKVFGKSSEKADVAAGSAAPSHPAAKSAGKKVRLQLPSERYPDAPLIERDVELEAMPGCRCCGAEMEDSGLTEDAEYLTVIPEQYLVIRQKRHKYRCGKCHGDLVTAPSPPRIKPGSAYSDELMVDVAMTKYCDLVPIERYAAIAGRAGMDGLPPQSLIESTHYLAEFIMPAYDKLRSEILASRVLHADETPHRMLEGDKRSSWFLWGFSTTKASYFECHATRSGDVAHRLLDASNCRYLVSDVYSGYGRAVKLTNVSREELGRERVLSVYCNAHARRRFKEASERFPDDAKFFLEIYQRIYQREGDLKGKPPDEVHRVRTEEIAPLFEELRARAFLLLPSFPEKSSLGRAISYLLENWAGLTLFLRHPELPVDNNPQERLLRNPVIGRKTWYGTHSKRGAETAAVLFSLVESCKLNQVNPRLYMKALVSDLHRGISPYTPAEFKTRATAVKTG
jgi:transposase